MKTTIDLPDDLLHRAKIVAAQRRTTLKELVLLGLESVMSPSPAGATEDLADALSKGYNTQPVGRLRREEIYDRPVFRRH
jgi:hypothetical protein